MEKKTYRNEGEAFFEGVDLYNFSQGSVISSFLESPENLKELVNLKEFPMDKSRVLDLFNELESEGIVVKECCPQDLDEKLYTADEILDILRIVLSKSLEKV